MDLDSYFLDQRFQAKIPEPNSRSYSKRVRDNVYCREGNKLLAISGNKHDDPGSFKKDTKGDLVYIAKDFYYFGYFVQNRCYGVPICH